jgi:phosphate starvation-inducible protein PhoH and related proteins
MTERVIEVAPLAFMRGRTLDNAFIILDEAQNTTPPQMKMFLTRLGPSAKCVVTGDLSQIDLPRNVRSGLLQSLDILKNIEGIAQIYLNADDVVRHRLVKEIVKAYDQSDLEQQLFMEKKKAEKMKEYENQKNAKSQESDKDK